MQAERTITRRGRGGRPPAKQAGDVDLRILEAAATLFLQRGFDGTSCEQVVALAGAGKASLYARYANKEELFAAVVRDHIDCTLAQPSDVPVDLTLHARLQIVGRSALAHALQRDEIQWMRVVLSNRQRMPDLARYFGEIVRNQAVQRIEACIAAGRANNAIETGRVRHIAEKFVELALIPVQLRALFGDDPAELVSAAGLHIDDTIELLAKAGRLDGWE